MSVDVRIPVRDTPSWIGVALVGVLSLAAGLGLATWARGAEEQGGEAGPPVEAGPSEAEAPAEPEPEPIAAEPIAAVEDAGSQPAVEPASEPEPEEPVAAEPVAEAPTVEAPPPSSPPPTGLVVRRGRIAYLRCDGVPPQRGPFPCPRDEAMEAAVWPAIDGLVACAQGPRQAGEGDLRIEFTGPGAPDVGWRDTFPRNTVRLDDTAVLACVRGPLAAARQSLGAQRLLVSFRFAVVAQ
jgi:hypothetical protein